MEFGSQRSYSAFARPVCRDLRFIRSTDSDRFLDTVLAMISSRHVTIGEGTVLWRAQVGHGLRTENHGEDEFEVPCAFPPKRMKPLSDRAADGRVNPKGIPCLYLATKKETAICEVRPWIGSYVSVAQFATTRVLNILDFGRDSMSSKIYLEEPKPHERTLAVWSDIDRAFSEPMTRTDDSADYVPTQIIAELLRKEGFDGIAYRSSIGEAGYNIALFNLEAAEVKNCGLRRIDKIVMEFSQQDNPYFVKKGKNEKS